MELATLLAAALGAALELLAEAGFGDEVRDLKERLTQRTEKQRQAAFEAAWGKAVDSAGDEALRSLLEHDPFRREVVSGLLDPQRGFDIASLAAEWGDRLPVHARALRTFFNTLENTLLGDATWGPLLERFQDLRFRRDVTERLRERNLDVPVHQLIAQVSVAVTGSGAASVGERPLAVGSGGVGVRDTVVKGDLTINVTNSLSPEVLAMFARQFGFDPTATDAEALQDYFSKVVFEKHSKLSFLFIRPERGEVYTEADVETVFVPLRITDPDATERQKRLARDLELFGRADRGDGQDDAARPVTLAEIVNKYPCFLLRGKPGCGKTTLLRHIALAFARGEQREKLGWEGPVLLPLVVPLRNFGVFVRARAKDGKYVEPQPRALLDYLEEHLRGAGVHFPPDFLARRLDAGQCFLLLDGLDEASGTLDGGGDLRTAVARHVAAFITRYQPKGNRFALSSRPRGFQEDGAIRRALPQPRICDVLDLGRDGFQQLITNLLVVLTGNEAAGRDEAGDLCARIDANPHLTDLAGNPLLCTTLVLVYKCRNRRLPERRVDVLHEIVLLLLGRWKEASADLAQPEELTLEGAPARTTEQAIQFRRRALVALAWHMQATNTAELTANDAAKVLADFYCSEERTDRPTAEKWARDFLEVAHLRSGLFIAADEGLHVFAHQAFREYLAATYLVNAGEGSLIEAVMQHAPEPDEWWDQVLLLAGAHPELSSGASGRLIETLLSGGDVAHAYLAARCAQDMIDRLPGAQRKCLQDRLLAAMQDEARPATERARAGDGLALAGDPRFRADRWYLPDEDGWGFVEVPAGPFRMGTPEADLDGLVRRYGGERVYYKDEVQESPVDLDAYYIARYPTTVAQFRAFVQASDYPFEQDRLRGLDNRPVVYVTWHDAAAYCDWLTGQLRVRADLPEWLRSLLCDRQWVVRLPTEAEWEKAARGDEGCQFPWGNTPDPNLANYDETGIGTTSAVGCFPGGRTPAGCLDMAGNVREWCHSLYKTYPYDAGDGREDPTVGRLRVVRGGAFGSRQGGVRCALRGWFVPNIRSGNIGFRVVVAPGLR